MGMSEMACRKARVGVREALESTSRMTQSSKTNNINCF